MRLLFLAVILAGCSTGYRMKPANHDPTYRERPGGPGALAVFSGPSQPDPPHGGGYPVTSLRGCWLSKLELADGDALAVFQDWFNAKHVFRRHGGVWAEVL